MPPDASARVATGMGSSATGWPLLSIAINRGPQTGHAIGSAWNRRSRGSSYSLRHASHISNAATVVRSRSYGLPVTIVSRGPHDRERTTMAAFEMCEACRSEYEDPRDRRFHAEPIACPVCGPRLMAIDSSGHPVADDPIPVATRALASGGIVAVKGLGGFHLACDAGNSDAIGELRQRKRRDDKPFAIMVESLTAIREICEVGSHEAVLLASAARPVVL